MKKPVILSEVKGSFKSAQDDIALSLRRRRGVSPSFSAAPPLFSKEVIEMLAWLSANLINIVLVAVLVLIVGLLMRGMVRDRRAGKCSCGGNCASCGACAGCASCAKCGSMRAAQSSEPVKN